MLRYQQPQSGIQKAGDYGLRHAFNYISNAGYCAASGKKFPFNTPSDAVAGVAKYGIGVTSGSANRQNLTGNGFSAANSSVTLRWVFSFTSTGALQCLFRGVTDLAPLVFGIYIGSGNDIRIYADNWSFVAVSAKTLIDGGYYDVVFERALNGSLSVWVNGDKWIDSVSTTFYPECNNFYAWGDHFSQGFVGRRYCFSAHETLAANRLVRSSPWQIFKGSPNVVLLFSQVIGAQPQLLSPSSDISTGAWTSSLGGALYAAIDETTVSDADYITANSATACEMKLATGIDPAVSTGHILRYRLLAGSGSLTVRLKQGTATIAAWGPHTLTGAVQDFAQTLTGAQADSITDYGDLRVSFEAA